MRITSLRVVLYTIVVCLLAHSPLVSAQESAPASPAAPAGNPLSAHNRSLYSGIKAIVLRTAQTVPEEHYAFRPVDGVRTFGEIVAHVADSQYTFCSVALGEKNSQAKVEATTKADLIAALEGAIGYCDTAYERMTDTNGTEMVKLMRSETPKLGTLAVNNIHTIEHYGNMVTYMRMKGLVPPTSDPEFMRSLMTK